MSRRWTMRDLLDLPRRELLGLLRDGHPIDPAALDDTEYRGVSLGLPAIVERLTWKTFKKVFHRDAATGHLRGWNVRMEQTGLDGAQNPMRRRDGAPRTFGHYRVVSAEGRRLPAALGAPGTFQGLLIDYGQGGNGPLDMMSRLVDPIVALEAGDSALLLGWSYLDLGVACVGTPSFFSLERDGPLTHRAAPRG